MTVPRSSGDLLSLFYQTNYILLLKFFVKLFSSPFSFSKNLNKLFVVKSFLGYILSETVWALKFLVHSGKLALIAP